VRGFKEGDAELRGVSFDHFGGGGEQRWRNVDPKRFRSLEIDHRLKLCRLLDGNRRRTGGIEHFSEKFTKPMTASWQTLGSPELTPESNAS
jgi:hypothetical protein